MRLIICVSENNGMLFNKRRQSSDVKVIEDIQKMVKEQGLYIGNFSSKLFDGVAVTVTDGIDAIPYDSYYFVEQGDIERVIPRVTQLVIYNWNRTYPADVYFNVDLTNWVVISKEDFVGNSHEKITKTVYERGQSK